MVTRHRVVAALAVLVAAVVLAAAGCGSRPSAEDAVRSAVAAGFDGFEKDRDQAFVDKMLGGVSGDLDRLGVDRKAFAKAYYAGMSCKVRDVSVDEEKGTATVDVTVSIKSMDEIISTFQKRFAKQAGAKGQWTTDQQLMDLGAKLMVQVAKDAKPRKTDISMTYERGSDGSWKLKGGDMAKVLTSALAR